jgi:hypothetical protein
MGVVLIQDQRIFSARDVQKGDARPGGFVTTGGHGGIVGAVGHEGPPVLTYLPARLHTHQSQVNITRLPAEVPGLHGPVRIKSEQGELLGSAIPKVAILKDANYYSEAPGEEQEDDDADLVALIDRNLKRYPLSGFVFEGLSPYGTSASATRVRTLTRAVHSGMPVVIVGRGNNEGFTAPLGVLIGGQNLTSTKARMLLMACLLRFGSLPAEGKGLREKLAEYQSVFDTH